MTFETKISNYDTPILFLVFNRPETTLLVFEAIKSIQPPKLYIAADGPRTNKINENNLCEEVKRITSKIDWPCTVKTLYREKNLGCKKAVNEAITWFFEQEEEGIILEDDCLPNISFFLFCSEMLQKYRSDNRIAMITGTNYLTQKESLHNSYFFSQHYTIWGWATWKRAWNNYDVNMSLYSKRKDELTKQIRLAYPWYYWIYLIYLFELIKSNSIDTWDIQWVFRCMVDNQLCVTPSLNLITNIGVIGAHSNVVGDSHFIKSYELDFSNLSSPISFLPNYQYDRRLLKQKYRMASLRITIKNKLKKLF